MIGGVGEIGFALPTDLFELSGSTLNLKTHIQSSTCLVSVSVSHVYFMKYSMMGLLHMPNIMGSIEADLYSTYQAILSPQV